MKLSMFQASRRIPVSSSPQLTQLKKIITGFEIRNFPHQHIMDQAGKEISMDAAIKMMNDQAHYEVRRNICLAVLLYFGMFMAYHG
jgi:hypothetical protein